MDLSTSMLQENLGSRYLENWDKKSSVRTHSKRVLSHAEGQTFYPKLEQPLCLHPLIASMGIDVHQRILIQTAYRFMLGISEHETKVVTSAIQRLICGALSLPDWLKLPLQTVIIDESYHAMVAYDFVQQVHSVTGEKPLPFPNDSDLGRALSLALQALPASIHDAFTMVAVCIAENLITQDLIVRAPDPEVNPFFYDVNRDHLVDEGRHAKLFTEVVRYLWPRLPLEQRQIILARLPSFIQMWMRREVSVECDRVIL
jgi:hypothetical protein